MTRYLSQAFVAIATICLTGSLFAIQQTEQAEQTDATASTENTHPLADDPTGIKWAFSLDEAIETARKTHRMVGLMPVSFRSKNGTDILSPAAEAMRAVTLVDSRVVNLINRRIVFYYFDMDKLGDRYDALASKLVMDLHPELKYFSTLPTPPMVFMTPERKMLGYIYKSAPPELFLEKMTAIIEQNPEYSELNEIEQNLADPVGHAFAYYELRQFDKALNALDKHTGSEAYYLRGLISREQEDWAEMKRSFKMITQKHRLEDATLEIGLRYWKIKNFEGLKAKFATVPKTHPRYQEAMYYLGLAYFQTHDPERAKLVWEEAVNANKKSAWAFRLDWSLGLAKLGQNSLLTPYDRIPSLLERYYMTPDGNPDMNKQN